jgi:hypothetical protein
MDGCGSKSALDEQALVVPTFRHFEILLSMQPQSHRLQLFFQELLVMQIGIVPIHCD